MNDSFWDIHVRPIARRVPLLELDPDLARELDPEREAAAAQHLTVPTEIVEAGAWHDGAAVPRGALGLLVVDGVLLRSHSLGRLTSAELLGAGDVIRPSITGHEFSLIEAESRWEAITPVQVALLDKGFLQSALRWPEVVVTLFERTVIRARLIAFQLALAHVRKVDARLLLLFWRLADRWGHVTPEGIVLPLRITHAALGKLVGAQRPSVTTALKQLERAGALRRSPDGTWLLLGDPPHPADPMLEPLVGGGTPAV
jgi:CRP/FNR family cyclic AMP-dependent transcriptional regulator